MATGNNANIWFQYSHKFDQLFTANEQIIPLNTFSNTFHHSKGIISCDKNFFERVRRPSRSPYKGPYETTTVTGNGNLKKAIV